MVGIVALLIGQWVTNAVTQAALNRRAAAKSKQPISKEAPPKPRCTDTGRTSDGSPPCPVMAHLTFCPRATAELIIGAELRYTGWVE